MLALTALVGLAGCETSSHKSVRTYDYRDEAQAPEQRPQEELNSEYQMVSPGEMVVDPNR
jgi:hypothetical protein